MPIRWRLTLWFSVILLIILSISAVFLYSRLQNYLTQEIDNNLKVYSAQVHGTLHPERIPEPVDYDVIHSRLPPINEFVSPGVYLQLLDISGKVVVKSNNLGKQELPVDPDLINFGFAGQAGIKTVAAGSGASVRIMVSPLYLTDQVLLLEVAESLHPLESMMSQLRWTLLAGILLAFIMAGISGVVMARRALSPVKQITRTAQDIEASADLSRRVGYKGPPDELGELASTFDHMIEHLNRVFESQKSFVADASHELRSPLTVIQGNLDLLKRNLTEADRQESLRAIDSETRRMTRIVADLLLLAEVETGKAELEDTVSLKDILLEEFKRAQSVAKNHKVSLGRQDDATIKGDPYRLKQLLSNLIDNAVKYTPEGGRITLSLFCENGWACLQVADTGIGISAEHLPHIFDRFYRVDKARSRARGGTGLGLAIVRGIAEQHGGKLNVASEPGKGSTFSVWFKI